MASNIIEHWKASAYQRQLCLPLLPFTHARSEIWPFAYLGGI